MYFPAVPPKWCLREKIQEIPPLPGFGEAEIIDRDKKTRAYITLNKISNYKTRTV
jgi:hypothetical protein